MPSIDEVYGTYVPEVVPPPPAVVPKERPNALAVFRSDPAALKASALAILDVKIKPVHTLDEANALADLIAQAKLVVKNIESRRVQIVEPLKREAKEVDAEAKRWSEPAHKVIENAERVLIAFRRKQAAEATRQEEARQEAIRQAAEKQDDDAIMALECEAPKEAVRGFKTDAGTSSIRTTWKVEVVDASLVPPAYLVPDLKKIQAAVDAGARQIDGCNIYEHESLVTRTR